MFDPFFHSTSTRFPQFLKSRMQACNNDPLTRTKSAATCHPFTSRVKPGPEKLFWKTANKVIEEAPFNVKSIQAMLLFQRFVFLPCVV